MLAKQTLTFVTSNVNKLIEVQAILSPNFTVNKILFSDKS